MAMSKSSLLLAVVALLCCYIPPSRAQLRVSDQDMQEAVSSLSEDINAITEEGLGLESLKDAFQSASYTPDTLSNTRITNLLQLQDRTLKDGINSILDTFANITSATNNANPPSSVPAQPCCQASAQGASFCVHGTVSNNGLLDGASRASLREGEAVLVGTTGGGVVQIPSSPVNCSTLDARLLPWFTGGVREYTRPLEVVLILDLIPVVNFIPQPFAAQIDLNEVRETASLIVNSLTTADTVGMVGLDTSMAVIPSVISRIHGTNPRNVPVCTDTILEMRGFSDSFTPSAPADSHTNVDYLATFRTALSLFSSSNETDKHLLFLGTGAVGTGLNSGVRAAIDNVENVAVAVYISVGTLNALPASTVVTLSTDPLRGFYNVPAFSLYCTADTCPVTFGHANIGTGNLLTMRRPLVGASPGKEFLGVLYALLPVEQLLGPLLAATAARQFSYVFVVNLHSDVLYHPLMPGDLVATVNITQMEPEGVITNVLTEAISSPAPVIKRHLVFAGATDTHSYVYRSVPSTYNCKSVSVANTILFVCLVLADEERTLLTLDLDNVNITGLHASRGVMPVYHDILESVAQENRCNYYCKQSIATQVSFQLTTPSQAPADFPGANLTEYILGGSQRPSFVLEGVAEEAAIGLDVTSTWLDPDSAPSNYITRRHLATPRGLYLTFPPSHLVPEFQPLLAEWYRSPAAHPSLVTIGTPRVDPLREGGRLTVSVGYAIRPPSDSNATDTGNGGGPPLAVLSADITLDSLRVLVLQALPRCETDSVQCIIVDDSGNLIYERDSASEGVASFFGREEARLRTVVSSLGGLAALRQCSDLFNPLIKSRRFYIFNTSRDDVFSEPDGHCAEVKAQHIPGTNAFLIAYEDRDCTNSLCSCAETCLNCDTFNPSFCECPCNCTDDCLLATGSSFVCPLTLPQLPSYQHVVEEQISTRSPAEPFCFNQRCSCRTDYESCFGVRDCHWCEAEQKCAHVTECCNLNDGRSCCGSEREQTRLQLYAGTCLRFATECFQHPLMNVTCPPTPPPIITTAAITTTDATTSSSATGPSSSNTSTIVAAVVGGLLGALLVALIIFFLVYYRFCRKPDPAEATSRESAFDFSNKAAISPGNSYSNNGGAPRGEKKAAKKNKNKKKGVQVGADAADIEKGALEDLAEEEGEGGRQEVTPPKDTDETTI